MLEWEAEAGAPWSRFSMESEALDAEFRCERRGWRAAADSGGNAESEPRSNSAEEWLAVGIAEVLALDGVSMERMGAKAE